VGFFTLAPRAQSRAAQAAPDALTASNIDALGGGAAVVGAEFDDGAEAGALLGLLRFAVFRIRRFGAGRALATLGLERLGVFFACASSLRRCLSSSLRLLANFRSIFSSLRRNLASFLSSLRRCFAIFDIRSLSLT
jgi:hypothetical protein